LPESHIHEPAPRRDLGSVLRVAGRGWPLVAALVIVVAGVTVWNELRQPSLYESQSVVTAVNTPIPVENFELSVTLFATDEVIAPVVSELGLEATPGQLLAARALEADWVSGGGVEIVGRSSSPEEAVDRANLAAASFDATLQEKDLGSFAVYMAQEATEVGRSSPVIAGLAGGALGGLLGLSVLAALFVFRQPLVTEQDALAEFPADRVYGVQVRFGSALGRRQKSEAAILPAGIEAAIIRESKLGRGGGDNGALCCLIFEKHRRGDRSVRYLLEKMDVLHRWTPVKKLDRYWIDASEGVPLKPLEGAATVLLIVSEGSRRSTLREVSEESLAVSSGPSWIMVFVKHRRRKRSTGPVPPEDDLVLHRPAVQRKPPQRESL
jgi:hypothetical protein